MNLYSNSTLLESRIYAASPAGLTLILMEEAVASIRAVRQSISELDARRRAREVTLLLEILSELTMSLKVETSPDAKKRQNIYASLQAMLIDAHAKVAVETFATVEKTLVQLFEDWKDVCRLLEGSALVPALPEETEYAGELRSTSPYLEDMVAMAGPSNRGWKF